VDAHGTPLWAANGVGICTADGHQGQISLVADGTGGALVAWLDWRSVDPGIYIQRVNAAGVPQWAADGVRLSMVSTNVYEPALLPDGSGGAIAAWHREGDAENGIYLQKIDNTGMVQWSAGGNLISDNLVNQESPVVVTDGAGGAIVVWDYYRAGSLWDIYAQRVDGSGVIQWSPFGDAVCSIDYYQQNVMCISDRAGGFIAVWQDARSELSWDIYAQRMDGSGQLLWYYSGLPVCTASEDQLNPRLVSDDDGGAIIIWNDVRHGTYDVFAQRVSAPGACLWATDGVALSTESGDQYDPQLDRDGEGGAIVTWMDLQSAVSYDIYAQRVSSSGVLHWPSIGMPVSIVPSHLYYPSIVMDGDGGAIIAWQDNRSYNYDIYCQRIELGFGKLGRPEPVISAIHDVPNDQGGLVNLTWDASYLDTDLSPEVDHYWIFRSVGSTLKDRAMASGARLVQNGETLPASWDHHLLATQYGTSTVYWEYLDQVEARHLVQGYSYLAATAFDSTESSNPLTLFMVAAMNADDTEYWMSDRDSGYSVDNLAPGAPAAFAGEYLGPTTALHWLPNTETDFLEYRLYRGKDPEFVPGPGSFVASMSDTGYVDPAGEAFFYKIAAVDIHGNVSPYSFTQPDGTVGIPPGGDLPANVQLYPAAPNPVRDRAVIRFDLPSAGDVRLMIYDVQGRAVRVAVAANQMPGGRHEWVWDRRDGAGNRVAPGIYFFVLRTGSQSLQTKVIVVD
jgi:hypothetical protein